VVRNRPYAGGFITEHYGEPALGRHALQVEINRALYMDERALSEKPGFAALSARLVAVFAEIAAAWEAESGARRMAAE
jgi:N-formylglutamate amidohydrolase